MFPLEHVFANEIFNGTFLGAGIAVKRSDCELKIGEEKQKIKSTPLFLSLALGAGKVMNACQFYWGTEVVADITKVKRKTLTNNMLHKRNGVDASLSMRFGQITGCSLMFAKVGISYSKNLVHNSNNVAQKVSCSKMTPLVGVGFECRFSDKYHARIDAEYIIKNKKSDNRLEFSKKNELVLR
jgi:hypothetical protein